MIKEVWEKKPETVWVPRGYYSESKIKEDDIQMIISHDMADWLEKLFDAYTKELCWQQDRFMEINKKLEAVKNHLNIFPKFSIMDLKIDKDNNPIPNEYKVWFKGLEEILGDEQ